MIESIAQKLPEYENPPVCEVACGILFEPIADFCSAYLGLLWEKYRSQYPICEEAYPLLPSIEKFESEDADSPSHISGMAFLPRTWFIENERTGLIQVQRDRFLTNWRRTKKLDSYPRYNTLIQKFSEGYSTFVEFIEEHKLGNLNPLQYELTYVNHIPQGEGWETLADVGNIFPDFSWRANSHRVLPDYENIGWNSSFVLPDKLSRLHIKIQNAIRKEDGCRLIVLDITVRGMTKNPSDEAMFQWFENAREWIVRSFADTTSEEIQNTIWRRTQ